jgi:ABC-type multidrug transport system fused ATPase/permease subunit/CRP-like cAMP-binding protein
MSEPRTVPWRRILQWYRPFLRGSGGRLAWWVVASVVVLACQAVIPLKVESLLHHGELTVVAVTTLVALVVVQLAVGYSARIRAHLVSTSVGSRLRLRLFDRTLNAPNLRGDELDRASIVNRHTADVDAVTQAAEVTLAEGFPGVARIIVSLVFLTVVDWRAGVTMTVAALAFVLIRRIVGHRLLEADRARVEALNRLGQNVDEAITGVRWVSGLRLEQWIGRRFRLRDDDLRHASHEQGQRVAQMAIGAQTAGLVGLVCVALFAVLAGGENLAAVAAALLYVEGVVRGLESLPPWVRSMHLAMVSQRRIDHVLLDDPRATVPEASVPLATIRGVIASLPASGEHRIIGLVTPAGIEPDAVLTAISADGDPAALRVTTEGLRIRAPGTRENVTHVDDEAIAFNESISAHLRAVQPDWTDEDIRRALATTGLADVADVAGGLDRPLGPMGATLTANEKQRLALTIALAASPARLLVGPITSLSEIDTAMPLLTALRDSACGQVVVSVRNPEVASALDLMVFVDRDGYLVGTHTELLSTSDEYARIWEERLRSEEIDLSVLGLDPAAQETMYARLLTERFEPGEVIYRQGDRADRIVFTISGHVEISTQSEDGHSRRVAVLGPGNHCGDLRLTLGEQRAETARAIDDCVIRSLSRDAIATGMAGLLDRPVTERRIVTTILRAGAISSAQLHEQLTDVAPPLLASSLAVLLRDGEVRDSAGQLSVVQRRSRKSGAADIFALLDE